jgi:hypothetical protein
MLPASESVTAVVYVGGSGIPVASENDQKTREKKPVRL